MEKTLAEEENENPNSPVPSSSSSSSDDDEAAENIQIESLEKSLAENPFEYDMHVQYIQCLRKCGHLEKLRQARESMNARFPLSPEMWLEWIKDEISCTSFEAFSEVEKLYERAVQEYLSAPLWCDYINFVQEHDASVSGLSPNGISKMRNLFERAITATGLHITEGNRIWEAYREFEQAICLTMNDDDIEEKEKQNDHIRSLYHRQLSVPLVDLMPTLKDYKLWESEQGNDNDPKSEFDGVPKNIVSAYRKAIELYNDRKRYEEKISDSDASDRERHQIFMNYIKFEESSGNPARIQVLYERAVSRFPVSSDLWLAYCNYLDRSLKVPAILRSVYSRATRNCMWVSELWVNYLLALERLHASEKELSEVFEQAVQCSFPSFKEYLDLFLTRVDGLRRRLSFHGAKDDGLDFTPISETFQRASEYFSPELLSRDDLLYMHSYWARLEVNLGNDIVAARSIWENLLRKSGTVLEVWQSYISMEIELGHINEARSIYKRCYSKRFQGTGSEVLKYRYWDQYRSLLELMKYFTLPNCWYTQVYGRLDQFVLDICNSWLRFEREHGTLDDFDLAKKKVGPRLQELMAFKAQQEAVASVAKQDNSQGAEAPKKRKINKVSESQQTPAKRKKSSSEPAEAPEVSVRASREINVAGETGKVDAKKSHVMDSDAKQHPGTSESKLDYYKDECTAFISNLSLEANEKHLHEFFRDTGGVTAIRVLRDRNTGKSRGLAYVDFSDSEHLAAAVAKNRQKLLGKKLSIARSDPKRSRKRASTDSDSSAVPGKKLTRGSSYKKAASEAIVGDKDGSNKKFTGSVTFAAPRALVRPLGWTKTEAAPDAESEHPKSNDEFRNMLLK